TVTLSVSISTIGSPLATRSPGALSQCTTLPVSWASSRAGMMTLAAIKALRRRDRASLLAAQRPSRLEDRLLRPHREVLQHGGERHRHVHRSDALDRGVEVVEGAVGDDGGDLGGDPVALVSLVHHDGARGLRGRVDERLLVERPRGPRVDHLGTDADL